MGKKKEFSWTINDGVSLVCVILLGITAGWGCLGVMQINNRLEKSLSAIRDRIYPDGNTQPLVTTCQVEKMIEGKERDGYVFMSPSEASPRSFFLGNPSGKVRVDVKIIDKSNTEYKVKWLYNGPYCVDENGRTNPPCLTKWIPKSDYHKYYTLEELSEKIDELESKKRK